MRARRRLLHPTAAGPTIAGPPHHLAQGEGAAAFHPWVGVCDQEQLALCRPVVGEVHHRERAAGLVVMDGFSIRV